MLGAGHVAMLPCCHVAMLPCCHVAMCWAAYGIAILRAFRPPALSLYPIFKSINGPYFCESWWFCRVTFNHVEYLQMLVNASHRTKCLTASLFTPEPVLYKPFWVKASVWMIVADSLLDPFFRRPRRPLQPETAGGAAGLSVLTWRYTLQECWCV